MTSLIIDIILILILLLSFIKGFKKGFFKRIINIIVLIGVIIGSFFLISPIKEIFKNTIDNNIIKIENYLITKDEFYSTIIIDNDKSLISEGINKLNIPSFLSDLITKNLVIETNQSIAYNLAPQLNNIISSIVIYLLLLVLFLIIFLFIKKICKTIISITPINLIDSLIGGIISLSFTILFISLLLLVIPLLLKYELFDFTHEFINKALELNTDKMTFTKYLYENNPLQLIISLIKTKL